jgi:protease-4
MAAAEVRKLADGRAYTGRQALALGLVDAIGGEPEARAWLAQEKGISETLPVKDVRVGSLAERALADSVMPWMVGAMKSLLAQGLMLDGAWAVWQPHQIAD